MLYAHQHDLSVVFPTDWTENLHIITQSSLFSGVSEQELLAMLRCLGVERAQYAKHQYVYRAGAQVAAVGLVISGRIHGLKVDFWGNRNLLFSAAPGSLFGEGWACSEAAVARADMVAVEPSDVLFFNVHRILTVCGSACTFHARVIRNLLQTVADQNLVLMNKIEHTMQRTTREKLLSYLSDQACKDGSNSFSIPFNRQELADYLSVERSAMCAELSRLRQEGLLTVSRNHFTLMRE